MDCVKRELKAVGDAELVENVVEMILDGLLGDEELFADFLVAETLGYQLHDFFFSLPPLQPVSRLERIYALARTFVVEVETHPVNEAEYQYLMSGEIFSQTGDIRIARPSAVVTSRTSAEGERK